jgi:hypothetical protein
MEEERFARETADDLTGRIADRLGERQKKLEQMAAWEQAARKPKVRPLYYLTAIAACVVAAVLLWPTNELSPMEELGIEAPTMTEYRAASAEIARIEELISEKNYEEAIRRTEKALKNSDLAIYELENVPEIWESDEEMAYEDERERVKNCELRWTYIYLLVQLERNKEARKELKVYLKYPQYCEHEEEARQLLIKLKK